MGPVASGPPTQLSISGAPSSGEPLRGAAAYMLEETHSASLVWRTLFSVVGYTCLEVGGQPHMGLWAPALLAFANFPKKGTALVSSLPLEKPCFASGSQQSCEKGPREGPCS